MSDVKNGHQTVLKSGVDRAKINISLDFAAYIDT